MYSFARLGTPTNPLVQVELRQVVRQMGAWSLPKDGARAKLKDTLAHFDTFLSNFLPANGTAEGSAAKVQQFESSTNVIAM